MAIYIGLIVYILALPAIVGIFCRDQDKKNKYVTILGMVAIFLLLALKADTVGIDIPGYKSIYEITANKAWGNYDYVYFENGYIFLMKVFNSIGASFQTFMVFVYALASLSMYIFIRKYSVDPSFSMIIFVCYQFLVFYISGVRQCLAMSLCLIAYIIFDKRKIPSYIMSFVVVYLASLVHESAIVFFAILIFAFIKSENINLFVYAGIIVASIIIRPFLWNIINTYFKEVDTETDITLGGNFIFVIAIALILFFINSKTNLIKVSFTEKELPSAIATNTATFTRVLFLGIAMMFAFSGNSLMRAAMYSYLVMIPALPNTIWKFDERMKIVLKLLFIFFFVWLFYTETLAPNQFDITPYKFFWQD